MMGRPGEVGVGCRRSHFLLPLGPMAKSARTDREAVTVRLPEAILRQVDRWRRANGATRAQAIQRLVEQALATEPSRRTSRKATQARAAELAGQEIDRRGDPSVDAAEQAKRKGRLIKGPQEFRRARRDK